MAQKALTGDRRPQERSMVFDRASPPHGHDRRLPPGSDGPVRRPARVSATAEPWVPLLIGTSEPAQRARLRALLGPVGFDIRWADDGDRVMTMLAERSPLLIVLAWRLPPTSGRNVCRQLRRRGLADEIPILMLTDDEEADTRIRALEVGADASIAPSAWTASLVDRIRGALRLTRSPAPDAPLRCGGLELEVQAGRVRRDGRPVPMAPIEARLLGLLMSHPDRVFSRDELKVHGWPGAAAVATRTVDVHMARLRKALDRPDGGDPIRTVRSVGYALSL